MSVATSSCAGARSEAAREARISDEDYAAIIDQLASARGLIERLPGTFSPMDEETLRDVLLVILDNQFGPAGGEMFSRDGKTDLIQRHAHGGPVFIVECKNWQGAKAFEHAVDQLSLPGMARHQGWSCGGCDQYRREGRIGAE